MPRWTNDCPSCQWLGSEGQYDLYLHNSSRPVARWGEGPKYLTANRWSPQSPLQLAWAEAQAQGLIPSPVIITIKHCSPYIIRGTMEMHGLHHQYAYWEAPHQRPGSYDVIFTDQWDQPLIHEDEWLVSVGGPPEDEDDPDPEEETTVCRVLRSQRAKIGEAILEVIEAEYLSMMQRWECRRVVSLPQ